MLRAFSWIMTVGFLSCCWTFIALHSVILKNRRLYCNNNHDDNNINFINNYKFHFEMVTFTKLIFQHLSWQSNVLKVLCSKLVAIITDGEKE